MPLSNARSQGGAGSLCAPEQTKNHQTHPRQLVDEPRTAAKKKFTLADHAEATKGIECRKDEEVIDETPAAYKDIAAVMAAQADLVDVAHTLKQVVCVKG